MTSRREILKSGLGLVGIISAAKAPAAIVKSLVGGNGMNYIESAGWKNPYVTDGLIAVWDGEWNAGWGVHDPDATVWKDLMGNRDWTHLPQNLMWGENCVDSVSGLKNGSRESWTVSPATIEVCGVAYTSMNGCFVFGFGSRKMFGILTSRNRGFQFASDEPTFRADFYNPWTVAATFLGNNIASGYYNAESRSVTAGSSTWGASTIVRFGDTEYLYKGKLFSVRLYNRALTAEEIVHNYAIDKERFGLS